MRLEAFLDNVAWLTLVWCLGHLGMYLVGDIGAELARPRPSAAEVAYTVIETVVRETPWPFFVVAVAWLLA